MNRPNLTVETFAFATADPVRGRACGRRRVRAPRPRPPDGWRGRGDPVRRRDQLAAAAPALGRRRRGRAARARDRRGGRPARRRREPAGPPRGVRAARAPRSRCSMAPYFAMQRRPAGGARVAAAQDAGRAPRTTSRRAGSCAATTRSRYPNLMYHFLPIAVRYDGHAARGRRRARLPGARRPDVLGRARQRARPSAADPRAKPALRFNYLSTENDRREWIEAIRVTRRILGAPAFGPLSGGELSPGAGGGDATSRSSTGSRRTPRRRCTRRARAGWEPTRRRSSTRSR